MYISEYKGRSNNLNFMKFLGAVLVIYAHENVVLGTTERFIKWPLNVGVDWGGMAVAFFFFSSGFYVTKSLLTGRNGEEFWLARIGRLYPALITVVLCTAFIAGPVLSEYSVDLYFRKKETYQYLLWLFMIPQYRLPGVFANNHLQYTVNASLWSLILEMICYAGLYCAFSLKMLEKKKLKWLNLIFVGAVFIIFVLKPQSIYQFRAYIRPLCTFIVGMEYYIFRENIKIDVLKMAVVIFIGSILYKIGLTDLWTILILPYLISGVVFCRKQVPRCFAVWGEYSYGVYLVAFPVQQTMVKYLSQMSVFQNTLLAVMISLSIAIPIHFLIEIPCFKKISVWQENDK